MCIVKCREHLDTAMGVITSPREFFSGIRREKLKVSAKYFAKLNLIVPVLLLIITLIVTYNPVYAIASAIRLYFLYLVLIIVSGLWSHVWLYVFGARKGIEQTLKTCFYASTPALLFGWIPALAPVFWLWSDALFVVGSSRIHKMHTSTALVALLVGWAITFMVIFSIAGPSVSQTLLPMVPA